MDGDNSLNLRNWGYYEPTTFHRGHLGLHLMPSSTETPLFDGRNASIMAASNGGGPFHHREMGGSQTMFPMDYMRDAWMREKLILSGNHNYTMIPETSSTAHHMQMVQPPDLSKDERVTPVEEVGNDIMDNGPSKKRPGPKAPKSPKQKKAKRGPRVPKADTVPTAPRARTIKKTAELVINGINMDISSIPIPVCSCTGIAQQCYRWGSGGWQSACCTTGLSMYPLPMSTKRRGARIAGRKMSIGAFKKVLEKLAAEGYNFVNPIDLRTHWAKHGTNKFVTIR